MSEETTERDENQTKQLMNVFQRLNEVRKAVKYIQKKKSVESYKAVEHDEVTAQIREHLVKQGIFVIPTVVESETKLTGTQTKGGTPVVRYEGRFKVDFVNMDNVTDVLSITVDAHANDHGDKAPGKAISYATKTAELKVLTLETGESDESRYQSEVETITEEDSADIQALLDEVGGDAKEAMFSWLKIDSVDKIPKKYHTQVVKALEKRRAQA